MNYYALRSAVAREVRDFIIEARQQPSSSYKEFVRRLVMNYGVTEKMIQEFFRLYPVEIQNDHVIRLENFTLSIAKKTTKVKT
jgi:hypothetical protein